MRGESSTSWHVPFVVLAAIWGASFLFIKVAVEGGVPPVDVALGRCLIGAAVLLALRPTLPRGWRVHGHFFVAALFWNAIPFVLFSYGETHISSVLAGIWNATAALWTVLFVLVLLPSERPSARRVAGLLIGFAGVMIVLGPGGGDLAGQLMCLGAAACYGVAFPYTRRFLSGRPEGGVAMAATQLAWASVQLSVVALVVGDTPQAPKLNAVLSMVALGALGSGLAYVLNFRIVRLAGATTAATIGYLIPLFSTVLGVIVLGESLSWNQPIGAVVVLAGVYLASRAGAPRRELVTAS